jgi:hypothetical protein
MSDLPPLPPGFVLDSPPAPLPPGIPAPPPGFELDQAPKQATPAPAEWPGTPVSSDAQSGNWPGTPVNAAPAGAQQRTPELGRTLQQGAAGVNEGLKSIFGGPADAIAAVADAVGDKVGGWFGSPPINLPKPSEFFNSATIAPAGDPENGLESAFRAGGDLVGQNIVPSGIASGLAGSGIRLAETAAPSVLNTIRGAANSYLDSIAARPVASALTEAAGAFGAGFGGDTARGVAEDAGYGPEGQQIAETLGQFGAPAFASAYSQRGPIALALKGGKNIVQGALSNAPVTSAIERNAERLAYANRTGRYVDPAVELPGDIANPNWATRRIDAGAANRARNAAELVGQDFRDVIQRPEAADNLAEAEAVQKEIPGFTPGVAKATGDPALLNLQQSMDSKAVGPELRAAKNLSDNNAQSIRDYLESIIPPVEGAKSPSFVGPMPATENPQDLVAKAVAGRVADDTSAINSQANKVQSRIQGVSDSLPETDRIAGGQALRDARTAAQQAMDAKTTALRGQIAAPDTVIELSPAKPATGLEPSQPAVTTTVDQALNRRASINQELRDYTSASARTVDDVKRIRALQAERDSIDSAINANADNVGGLRAYADQYKNENVPQFRQGASAEVGRRDSFGYDGNRIDPEKVAGKFFNPNEESAAAQFDKSMGHDPAARQQMVDHALDDIRQKGVDPTTDLLKEGFVDKWLQKNSRVLAQMPQTGPEIRAAVKSKNPDDLYARLADLEQRQRTVANTKVAGLLGKNPEQQIDAALNDWHGRTLTWVFPNRPKPSTYLATTAANALTDSGQHRKHFNPT